MALPSNDHHVHSSGYFSEQGEADTERMVEELADSINEMGVTHNVYPDVDSDGPFIEVEFDDVEDAHMQIEDEAFEWGCHTEKLSDGLLEVRIE